MARSDYSNYDPAKLIAYCIEEDFRRNDLLYRLVGEDSDSNTSSPTTSTSLPALTTSGLSETDYHSAPQEELGVVLLRQTSYQPFPSEVEERLKNIKSNFTAGLLPSIGRAYASVNNELFLWRFLTAPPPQLSREATTSLPSFQPMVVGADTGAGAIDLVCFDKLRSPVVAVAVTRPKPGVVFPTTPSFSNQPSAMLAVATTTDLVLLGLYFTPNAAMAALRRGGDDGGDDREALMDELSGELEVGWACDGMDNYDDDDGGYQRGRLMGRVLFQVALDGLVVNSVCCTQTSGRIFFTAAGDLYEVDYWTRTWLGSISGCIFTNHSKSLLSYFIPQLAIFRARDEIRQLAVDDSRHLLYALFASGSLQVFRLGGGAAEERSSIVKVAQLQRAELESEVLRAVREGASQKWGLTAGSADIMGQLWREITSVCVVPRRHSKRIGFFLLSSRGVRVYFYVSNSMVTSAEQRGTTIAIRVAHIRFPAANPFFFGRETSSIYNCHYSLDGELLLMATNPRESFSPQQHHLLPSTTTGLEMTMENGPPPIMGAPPSSAVAAKGSTLVRTFSCAVTTQPWRRRQHGGGGGSSKATTLEEHCPAALPFKGGVWDICSSSSRSAAAAVYVLATRGIFTIHHTTAVELLREALLATSISSGGIFRKRGGGGEESGEAKAAVESKPVTALVKYLGPEETCYLALCLLCGGGMKDGNGGDGGSAVETQALALFMKYATTPSDVFVAAITSTTSHNRPAPAVQRTTLAGGGAISPILQGHHPLLQRVVASSTAGSGAFKRRSRSPREAPSIAGISALRSPLRTSTPQQRASDGGDDEDGYGEDDALVVPAKRMRPSSLSPPQNYSLAMSDDFSPLASSLKSPCPIFESPSPYGEGDGLVREEPCRTTTAGQVALYLYLSRALSSLWGTSLLAAAEDRKVSFYTPIKKSEMDELALNLSSLLGVLNKYPNIILTPSSSIKLSTKSSHSSKPATPHDHDDDDQKRFSPLLNWVERALEVAHLWRILLDHEFFSTHQPATTTTTAASGSGGRTTSSGSPIVPAPLRARLLSTTFGGLLTLLDHTISGRRGGPSSAEGEELCAELITALLRAHMPAGSDAGGDGVEASQISTAALSQRLAAECPTLFTRDDAAVARATQALYKSRFKDEVNAKTGNKGREAASFETTREDVDEVARKKQLVNEAVSTLQHSIDRQDIRVVCDLLLQVHDFTAIVDMALAKANRSSDAAGLASRMEKPLKNGDVRKMVEKRNEAYRCITQLLSLLLTLEKGESIGVESEEAMGNGGDGGVLAFYPSAESALGGMTCKDAQKHRLAMLLRVFNSDDEMANAAVFDWLLANNLADLAIEYRCRFFESYLSREIDEGRAVSRCLELLWRLHEQCGDYLRAAKALYNIAVKDFGQQGRSGEPGKTPLALRISYLSHALKCIEIAEREAQAETKIGGDATRSSELPSTSAAVTTTDNSSDELSSYAGGRTKSSQTGELRSLIADHLDVAKVQLRTRDAVKALLPSARGFSRTELEKALAELDSSCPRLYNLTELFERYAQHFNLPEVKLAIMRCAEHYEIELVEEAWQSILDRELKPLESGEANASSTCTKLSHLLLDMKHQYLVSAPQFIPYEFIIRHLLVNAFRRSLTASWLLVLCHDAKIPITTLVEVVSAQYRIYDPFWKHNPQARLYMVGLATEVVEEFLANVGKIQPNERNVLRNACLDFIAALLLDTQMLMASGSNEGVVGNGENSEIRKGLEALQAKLERIAA